MTGPAPALRDGARLLIALGLLGCSAEPADREPVAVTEAALSACDETVPANRYIDGIPAYAQCSASQNSAIYSNNGVDTSLTQMGSDWVRTQYSGGYQCTELAHRYLYFKWQVKWIPNGNAGMWCDTTPPATSGLVQTMTPVHGDLMVLAPGSCGADKTAGHVNVVDTVSTGKVVAVEQNQANRGTYMQSCAKCFLHVVANDGTAPAGGAGAPATSGTGGNAATMGGSAGRSVGAAGMNMNVTTGGASGMPATMQPAPSQMPSNPAPTTPAAMMPAATPPASQSTTGAAGASPIGSAGAPAATQPATVPLPKSSGSSAAGCNISGAGAPNTLATSWLPVMLALVPLMLRRRRRFALQPR